MSYARLVMGRGVRNGFVSGGLLVSVLALVACGQSKKPGHGSTAAAAGAGPSDNTGGQAGTAAETTCEPEAQLSPTRVILLSDRQYRNAVRDLFGVDVALAAAAPEAPGNAAPDALEQATVLTAELADRYHLAAAEVAKQLEPCGAATPDTACMTEFLTAKLARAWRRPVEPAEQASILSLFEAGLQLSPEAAVAVTVSAMLESGSFLYRTELGAAANEPGPVTLTPYELAAAIGFTYLDSIPDDELWAKAVDGSLSEPDVLAAEADRLLALPVARDTLRRKVSSYLGFEDLRRANTKDPAIFPDYSADVQSGLYESSQLFLDELLWHGTFSELFTSKRLYVNETLASFYGIPGVKGSALSAITFDTDERRAGLLSQPAFLTAINARRSSSDISRRGGFVLSAFLCPSTPLPPHPRPIEEIALGPGSVHEQWRAMNEEPVCGACHQVFDPYGFAMEKYDAVGRYRTVDETGAAVDSSAELSGVGPDFDGPVADINEVAAKFSQGRRASDCAAVRLTSYALDHSLSIEHLPCAVTELQDELAQNGSFPELFKALITSPAFLTREAP